MTDETWTEAQMMCDEQRAEIVSLREENAAERAEHAFLRDRISELESE